MSEKVREKINQEDEPRLKLNLRYFKAGHYPDIKPPPWGLNEIFLMDQPELQERIDKLSLQPGEEKFLVKAEVKFGARIEILDIKAVRDKKNPATIYLRAYPQLDP